MSKSMPIAVLEPKGRDDPLKGVQQAKACAECERYEVKYVFATNGHGYDR
jgi:type I restriction enzyme R subunit